MKFFVYSPLVLYTKKRPAIASLSLQIFSACLCFVEIRGIHHRNLIAVNAVLQQVCTMLELDCLHDGLAVVFLLFVLHDCLPYFFKIFLP